MNIPGPVPSWVLVDNEIVGFDVVDQTIPLDVTTLPPSEVTLPPDTADVNVIDEAVVVVTVGTVVDDKVVNDICVP